ncbi:MAG: hypothetical protein QW666_04495, partial [Candidatus Woesearchaeota archaeon]
SSLVQDTGLGKQSSTPAVAGSNPAHPISSRLEFEKGKLSAFIGLVKKKTGLSWEALANKMHMNEWSLRIGYGEERFLISLKNYKLLCHLARINEREFLRFVKFMYPENWGKTKGGQITGRRACQTWLKKYTGQHEIKLPQFTERLAEFAGILFGDGYLSKHNYCICITSHKINESKYSDYITQLIVNLFGIKPKTRILENKNAVQTFFNSKQIHTFLRELTIPCGRKRGQELKIPKWVLARKDFLRGFIRGFSDSEGSLFMSAEDSVFNIRSSDLTLLHLLQDALRSYGLHFALTGDRLQTHSVAAIENYFCDIGSSNPKQIIKFLEYVKNKRTIRNHQIATILKNCSFSLPYYYTVKGSGP